MPRLFWTFPDGLPGAGLLLLRVALSGVLLSRLMTAWQGPPPGPSPVPVVAEGLAALFLLAGFGTPLWAAGIGAIELWRAGAHPDDLLLHGLIATISAALALLGPGAASVDARLFGWRRLDVREPRR